MSQEINYEGLIDECLARGFQKMFHSEQIANQKIIKNLQNLSIKLNGICMNLKPSETKNFGGQIAQRSYLLYEALIYKFGQSNKHQKFWKISMQIYRDLKRINGQKNLFDSFSKFTQALESGNFAYEPSETAFTYLGALILERILRLDRLRMHCFRAADSSMGYVELGHLLTFNLMSIAIASDVANEAFLNIRYLCEIYNSLSNWFREYDDRFPKSTDYLKLYSMKVNFLDSSKVNTKLNISLMKSLLEVVNFTDEDLL